MQLRLSDPSYTDRLASFLRSLGQTAIVAAPEKMREVPRHNFHPFILGKDKNDG